jgi:hypothetical protein
MSSERGTVNPTTAPTLAARKGWTWEASAQNVWEDGVKELGPA